MSCTDAPMSAAGQTTVPTVAAATNPAIAPSTVVAGGDVAPAAAPTLETILATVVQLQAAIEALAQTLAGAGMITDPAAVTGGGAPTSTPTASAGCCATNGASALGSPTQSPVQSPGQGPINCDGPNVKRRILSKDHLEQDPQLRGKLDPPTGGKPPKGVKVRTNADGTRAVTINIHAATPANKKRGPQNESMKALRDIAAYVNDIDPDVVMVQEIHDRPFNASKRGISPMSSVLAHLIKADDMAFTPGNGLDGGGTQSGTAIYTRNGHTISQAVNADLMETNDPANRSAGIAVIQPPDGRAAYTVISTHLSNAATKARANDRHDQLAELARIADSIRRGGTFTYDAVGGGQQTASGFPPDRILLGGDLNTTRGGRFANDSADKLLGAAGLSHADAGIRALGNRGIDHIYELGFTTSLSARTQVDARELRQGDPTDHPGYTAEFR